MANKSTLNLQIKKYREQMGLSQSELANELGLGSSAISNYESGTRTPSIESLIKLSSFFGTTIDALIRGEEGNDSTEFYHIVDSNTASPRIMPGDTVLIKRTDNCTHGSIFLVRIGSQKPCLCMIFLHDEGITLCRSMDKDGPKYFSEEQIRNKEIEIIGKAIRLYAKLQS